MTTPTTQPDGPNRPAPGGGLLSADEAAEFAAQAAELTRAGLPLEGGLRAMADELPRGRPGARRLAATLREMAGELESGTPVAEMVQRQAPQLPASVRGLLLAGVKSGRLGEALEEYLFVERQQAELRRRVMRALAYPTFVMVMLAMLVVVFSATIVPSIGRIFDDFGARLPVLTRVVLAAGRNWPYQLLALGLLAGLVVVAWRWRRVGWMQFCLEWVPLLGPLWKWSRMVSFSRLMSLFLRQGIRLPDALRLAAEGVAMPSFCQACSRLAADVEGGRPLADALPYCRALPPTMIPLVRWGERTSSLHEAFDSAARMYESRTRVTAHLFEALLPVIAFVTAAGVISLLIVAVYLPLVTLIQRLT